VPTSLARSSVITLLILGGGAAPGVAQFASVAVVSGLARPVAFVQDPSDATVQLIVEQDGHIQVLQNGALLPTHYLDLSGVTNAFGEQGLLGLAFAPDYATSGRLFVNFVNASGNTVIARFNRSVHDPLQADPLSRFDLVWPPGQPFIDQPFDNHKGGHLAFGPDGYLYIGMGDGGAGGDPFHLAQDPMSLLGKMLRINVSVPDSDPEGYDIPPDNPWSSGGGVLPEIWAFGLRNPWRWSFDSLTGALVIGDVGQNTWEEIDYEPAGVGGRNYGWRNREGAHDLDTSEDPFHGTAPGPGILTDPVFEYSHAVGNSVTGGFVYRGTALGPAYVGRYFFGDFIDGRIWSIAIDSNGTASALIEHSAGLGAGAMLPSSFGVDASGELYVVNYSGTVRKIVLASSCTSPDPFGILGGGTCVDGGWLPPGFGGAPPGGSSGGCTTPDPFVILGGGTCMNGGWLPPGFGGAQPSGAGDTSPPPPPPSAGSSGGCTTPDPFVILGGGTCVNGGWLPPGLGSPPAPGGGSPPTPPAPPSGSPGGCTTPDPFVILGGGTCVNGGWLPPGLLLPSS
jgi:glucose/arabinose dehydrogenase